MAGVRRRCQATHIGECTDWCAAEQESARKGVRGKKANQDFVAVEIYSDDARSVGLPGFLPAKRVHLAPVVADRNTAVGDWKGHGPVNT